MLPRIAALVDELLEPTEADRPLRGEACRSERRDAWPPRTR